ncbi:MAG: FadR family transcriptional regulator, partial [Faecalibacterium sp.]|nr:FadR family transcriptional regulator [Faecalibacterium sp.]
MSEFSHLKNKLLAEQVEDEIYHYILDTPLEPGAKLPNEFELGEKFGVGRSTVREAVKLLSSKGIVEVRRGSGTYVVTTAKGLSDPLNLRSVQDKNALALDLVNVRLLLEPGMAEMAALNASDEDIERIQRLCDRVESKIHSGDLYIEDDIAFHTC